MAPLAATAAVGNTGERCIGGKGDQLRFCTVIASNYLGYARVLGGSLRAQHPECGFTVLVVDPGPVEIRDEDHFDVVRPADLGLSADEFRHMAAIYNVVELATAVKPTLLASLLESCGEPICYLDPDIEVFGRLDGLEDLALRYGTVLTPHTTTPIPRDGKGIEEKTIVLAGVYNLGFIAVSSRARPFLEWWKEHLRRDCRVAPAEGVFVDQRWVEVASTYFEHVVVTDPGWNVAYWNLHARSVGHGAHGYLVEGRPLRFFHFSGFSPLRPERLSRHQGETPRIHLVDHPAVAQLCARYAKKLLAAGYLETAAASYRFDYTGNGLPIDSRTRDIYRLALNKMELEGAPVRLPDPFDASTAEEFLDWLCLPTGYWGIDRIPRYLRRFHREHLAMQVHFPDIRGRDATGYLEFIRLYSQSSTDMPPWFVRGSIARPEWPPSPSASVPTRRGVNVIGYLRAENGVGEVARLLIETLRHAAIPYATVDWDQTPARQAHASFRSCRPPVYDVNVICVNADQVRRLPGSAFVLPNHHRRIGIWAWEVSVFPEWMRPSAALVDEIWTYSRHSAEAIAPVVDVPVHVFPPPIVARRPPAVERSALGLPPGFLFLFCFDYHSVFERKNPLGLVEAFSRAFRPEEGPQLVIKTVNAPSFPVDSARLCAAAAARPDITILDGYATRDEQDALMACSDAYVSLHRAEGYGLTLAEAMALGKPTVATGYSGNLEFMHAGNSRLVPYRLTAIPVGCLPYPPEGEWAEPDLDTAAAIMRDLAADPASAARLGVRGREDVLAHGPAASAPFVLERLLTPHVRAS